MLDRIPRPVFVMALLAILALGVALGTNAFVARTLSVSPERLAAARAGTPAARPATADPGGGSDVGGTTVATASKSKTPQRVEFWLTPIVNRNLFDSENALLGKKETPKVEGGEEGEATESDIAATLVSTSVALDPLWSTALINTDDGTNVYRIDEQLLDAVIKEIHRPSAERGAHVVLLRNGGREILEVGGEKRDAPKNTARQTKATPKKTSRNGRHEWGEVKKTGDNEYEVGQDDLDYALGNLDKLAREARVVPNFSDGKTNGFKVFAIRRNSIFRKMGLKNNDVLTGINGFDLSNTDKALEVYSKLASEKNFSVEVLRNGEPVSLEYSVK